ncbi:phosphorylcholine transferase LicD [Clostridium botulinum]|uniref:LicD family protein n=1 Tax=Clostridium botulinum TaxID=1491 RepID=UPI001C9B3D71|nr:LicD family protein [Clostridium botulinum]MBY6811413.1 LicD family protein [Clostridium botulinum]MBY6824836.1 LicD family protein [Clostridium botulinum]MBY6835226.1 LicD family protein [Clostridium botulinum]MBY6973739.1 LicD family protein [Clostridium botulinum]HBJ1651646.1 LicD family protein [Clostridium botulinum]
MNDNKKVQELTLVMLQEFIKVCEENNLRWFFTGGALIGVLRHKGYIPWDDDIDIGMPRPDYEKFLKISESMLSKGYGISNHETDPTWCFNMSQLIDEESEIEIFTSETPRICNIWIDIFPLDGLPNNKMNRWFHIKRILIFRYLVQIAHIETQVDANRVGRPWCERAILKLLKIIPVGKMFNTEKLLKSMEKCLLKYSYDKYEYVGNMLGRYREREAVPKKYFGKAKKMYFENIDVNVPEMSHELQTALYGDYMKLPSENDREGHKISIVELRNIKK